MSGMFHPDIQALFDLIRLELKADQEIFLVGGAVRDLLLGSALHDLDFVMAFDPSALARRVANKLDAGFFMLDDERHTARVMFYTSDETLFPLDFVAFTGSTLLDDLASRDFTINAMALSLSDMDSLIDPYGGQPDLSRGLIRACTTHALLQDPVRVLRGVRQALAFHFNIEEDTQALMTQAASHLPKTSHERQRDELFKILSGPNPAQGMADLQRFHVFDTLIPALVDQLEIPASPPHVYPLWQHTLKTVDVVSRFMEMIEASSSAVESDVWWMDAFQEKLARFFPDFRSYLQDNLTPGREKKQLLLLGALLHDIGKPMTMSFGEDGCLHYYGHDAAGEEMTEAAGRRLQLSNLEITWLSLIVRYHMRLLPLINQDAPPSRRAVYRFFKKASTAGAAITLLSLADTAATFGDQLDPQHWDKALQVVEVILSAWWEERETVVQPQLYLNGHDIQRIFELKPGKMIGVLLRQLSEAQAAGQIEDRQAAIALVQQLLEQQ